SGFGIGVAVLAVAHRLFVRGLRVGARGLVGTGHGSSVTSSGRVASGAILSVRILLPALRCEKGAVNENLAAHRRVLSEGRDEGCALVVFPEMSLTGSLHPSG